MAGFPLARQATTQSHEARIAPPAASKIVALLPRRQTLGPPPGERRSPLRTGDGRPKHTRTLRRKKTKGVGHGAAPTHQPQPSGIRGVVGEPDNSPGQGRVAVVALNFSSACADPSFPSGQALKVGATQTAAAYRDLGNENPAPITPAYERQADPVIELQLEKAAIRLAYPLDGNLMANAARQNP